MAVGRLLVLAGSISSSSDAIATYRLTGRVFVIVIVAIYIALAHKARYLNSHCSSSRSKKDIWRSSHDSFTNGDPTLSISLRDDAEPTPSPRIQWCSYDEVVRQSDVFNSGLTMISRFQ